MTILFYILIALLSAVMLTAAVLVVFRIGENEKIAQYTHNDERRANK